LNGFRDLVRSVDDNEKSFLLTGKLETSGCATFARGSDGIIGVRVKLNPAGTVTEGPTVADR